MSKKESDSKKAVADGGFFGGEKYSSPAKCPKCGGTDFQPLWGEDEETGERIVKAHECKNPDCLRVIPVE